MSQGCHGRPIGTEEPEMIDSTLPPSNAASSDTTTSASEAHNNSHETATNPYAKTIFDLHVHAFEHKDIERFVDSLVYHLAQIAAVNGAATGDIVARLGYQIRRITE